MEGLNWPPSLNLNSSGLVSGLAVVTDSASAYEEFVTLSSPIFLLSVTVIAELVFGFTDSPLFPGSSAKVSPTPGLDDSSTPKVRYEMLSETIRRATTKDLENTLKVLLDSLI